MKYHIIVRRDELLLYEKDSEHIDEDLATGDWGDCIGEAGDSTEEWVTYEEVPT